MNPIFFQGGDKVWLSVQKDATGVWRTPNGNPLTPLNSDWDTGEPVNAAGANCAAMVKLSK